MLQKRWPPMVMLAGNILPIHRSKAKSSYQLEKTAASASGGRKAGRDQISRRPETEATSTMEETRFIGNTCPAPLPWIFMSSEMYFTRIIDFLPFLAQIKVLRDRILSKSDWIQGCEQVKLVWCQVLKSSRLVGAHSSTRLKSEDNSFKKLIYIIYIFSYLYIINLFF